MLIYMYIMSNHHTRVAPIPLAWCASLPVLVHYRSYYCFHTHLPIPIPVFVSIVSTVASRLFCSPTMQTNKYAMRTTLPTPSTWELSQALKLPLGLTLVPNIASQRMCN